MHNALLLRVPRDRDPPACRKSTRRISSTVDTSRAKRCGRQLQQLQQQQQRLFCFSPSGRSFCCCCCCCRAKKTQKQKRSLSLVRLLADCIDANSASFFSFFAFFCIPLPAEHPVASNPQYSLQRRSGAEEGRARALKTDSLNWKN